MIKSCVIIQSKVKRVTMKRRKIFATLAIFSAIFVQISLAAQATNCRMSPDNDEDNVIDEGESVTLQCSFTGGGSSGGSTKVRFSTLT